ncbi:hypothetical protein C0991_004137, partial [Blastosporella zonata]
AEQTAATAEVTKYETEVEAVGDMDDLTKERDRLQGLIKANKSSILDFTVCAHVADNAQA